MNCRMARGVYLRANGELNCYCSTGEQVSLGQVPVDGSDFRFVAEQYQAAAFRHIRDSLSAERLPFPSKCLKCNYLTPDDAFPADLVDKEIEWFHIEPAAVCNLRCPYCVHGIKSDVRKYSREKPYYLPQDVYGKILNDIKSAGYAIKWMYFSGRGEPGLHRNCWDMVRQAKVLFDTNFLVNTNGNIQYDDNIVDSGLDKIKIALDSLDQKTYSRYRIGGDVEQVVRLTDKIAERKARTNAAGPSIIWQKVLHYYNDGKDELEQYQRIAEQHGVDRIRFVYTFTKDYGQSGPSDLVRIFPQVDIVDCRERDDIKPPMLAEKLDAAARSGTVPAYMVVAVDILHWLQMGMADRDGYDAFARRELDDPALYEMRRGDESFVDYMGVLATVYEALAAKYSSNGDTDSGDVYRRNASVIREKILMAGQ
jgi:organic radical activating enzyme